AAVAINSSQSGCHRRQASHGPKNGEQMATAEEGVDVERARLEVDRHVDLKPPLGVGLEGWSCRSGSRTERSPSRRRARSFEATMSEPLTRRLASPRLTTFSRPRVQLPPPAPVFRVSLDRAMSSRWRIDRLGRTKRRSDRVTRIARMPRGEHVGSSHRHGHLPFHGYRGQYAALAAA